MQHYDTVAESQSVPEGNPPRPEDTFVVDWPVDDEEDILRWSKIRQLSRVWADTSSHISDVLTLLQSTRALTNGNLVRFGNDLYAVREWLPDLENAIANIETSDDAPHEYETMDFQGHLLAMVDLMRDFTREAMRIEVRFNGQLARLQTEYQSLFQRWKPQMDRTDRSFKNAGTRGILHTLEDRKYRCLLHLLLEIYATLRQYFYDFRLVFT